MSPRILRRPVCTPESESESECRPHYGQKLSWAGLCSLLAAMALDTDFLSLINPKHVSYRVRRYKALLATDHDPQIQHLSTGRRGRHPSIPRLRHTPSVCTQSLWFVWHATRHQLPALASVHQW